MINLPKTPTRIVYDDLVNCLSVMITVQHIHLLFLQQLWILYVSAQTTPELVVSGGLGRFCLHFRFVEDREQVGNPRRIDDHVFHLTCIIINTNWNI